jgi:hypothetical protein
MNTVQEALADEMFDKIQELLMGGVTMQQINNRFQKWLAVNAPMQKKGGSITVGMDSIQIDPKRVEMLKKGLI